MKKIVTFIFFVIVISLASCRYVHNASDTAFKEFSPSALLQKYEQFKDASAMLDKKLADIKVYEARNKSMLDAYKGVGRDKWARDDREQYNVWQSELIGVKASYNTLAAEYNSAMVKFNYKFCNVGDLPQGATTPLPREYKPYVTE